MLFWFNKLLKENKSYLFLGILKNKKLEWYDLIFIKKKVFSKYKFKSRLSSKKTIFFTFKKKHRTFA